MGNLEGTTYFVLGEQDIAVFIVLAAVHGYFAQALKAEEIPPESGIVDVWPGTVAIRLTGIDNIPYKRYEDFINSWIHRKQLEQFVLIQKASA